MSRSLQRPPVTAIPVSSATSSRHRTERQGVVPGQRSSLEAAAGDALLPDDLRRRAAAGHPVLVGDGRKVIVVDDPRVNGTKLAARSAVSVD